MGRTSCYPGTALAVALVLGAAVALSSLSVQCNARARCVASGTCLEVESVGCSFRNSVSSGSWSLYGGKTGVAALKAADRGVCAPGMRQNQVNGKLTCTRMASFPGALNAELFGSSDAAKPHERYCGAWQNALSTRAFTPWAFFDASDVADSVRAAVRAKSAVGAGSRSTGSALSRFFASCKRDIRSSLHAQSSHQAFVYLTAASVGESVDSLEGVVGALGTIAGHSCDSPLVVVESSRNQAEIRRGVWDSDFVDALYAVGEESSAASLANRFERRFTMFLGEPATADSHTFGSSLADIYLMRATGSSAFFLTRTLVEESSEASSVIDAFERTRALLGSDAASAFIKGLAASCVSALSRLLVEGGGIPAKGGSRGLKRQQVAPLGRALPKTGFPLDLNAGDMQYVARDSIQTAARRAPFCTGDECCSLASEVLFPEHHDDVAYQMLVPASLQRKVDELVPRVRVAVSQAMRSPPFYGVTDDVGCPLCELVGSIGFRIGGGPVDGVELPYAEDVTSEDGVVSIMVKHAASVFQHRLKLRAMGECNELPVYSAAARNAYYISSSTGGCVTVLPGILTSPVVGTLYDDESLVSRLGWIVAHEMAHVTSGRAWNTQTTELLSSFPRNEHDETLADAIAAHAVLLLNVSNGAICGHLSQLWCAAGEKPEPDPLAVHPPFDTRGDRVCGIIGVGS